MLALLAAALAASTPSPAPAPAVQSPALDSGPVLESTAPWWERITVVVDDKGEQKSCLYETSRNGAEACDPAMAASVKVDGDSDPGIFSKVTFERRFSPGGRPDAGRLQPGDTLLGQQVMFLTIDPKGAIESCKLVATSGNAPADYGCDQARQEQFRAHANAQPGARQGFMTVLAYGHTERIA
ncbi:MAG TPA: hypothetical protein VK485_03610 [Sphingomicrobium sp.]|nr:hypothetical protein [Sphingomicrobium sp.]